MNKSITSIRGMHDYLSEELHLWNKIKFIIIEVLESYCYLEIKLPLLEKTEIFQKAIGNVTDIIEKEMYSFNDKKGRSLTLRPEGTVGCIRALIQNQLIQENKYQKFWYCGPMFRYERPQKGRYRQFYQLGFEAFGLNTADSDLEMIMLTHRLWKKMGINSEVILEINSIGALSDRIKYQKELVLFLKKYVSFLDHESKKRIYTNPLRILDSKNPKVQNILQKAPLLSEYINIYSQKHFKNLCKMMNVQGIKYRHNENLIRGLDYYNDTVFEWKGNNLGSQNTICAGGRYDTLVHNMGGQHTPAIGCAIGMERLLLLTKSLNIFSQKTKNINIYIIFSDEINKHDAINLSEEIRNIYPKLKIFINFHDCSIKKKIQYAVHSSARLAIFIDMHVIQKQLFLVQDLKDKQKYFFSKNELMLKIKSFFI